MSPADTGQTSACSPAHAHTHTHTHTHTVRGGGGGGREDCYMYMYIRHVLFDTHSKQNSEKVHGHTKQIYFPSSSSVFMYHTHAHTQHTCSIVHKPTFLTSTILLLKGSEVARDFSFFSWNKSFTQASPPSCCICTHTPYTHALTCTFVNVQCTCTCICCSMSTGNTHSIITEEEWKVF